MEHRSLLDETALVLALTAVSLAAQQTIGLSRLSTCEKGWLKIRRLLGEENPSFSGGQCAERSRMYVAAHLAPSTAVVGEPCPDEEKSIVDLADARHVIELRHSLVCRWPDYLNLCPGSKIG